MRAAEYFVLVNDEETGPFTLDQIREMVRSGEITAETNIAVPGWSEWLEVKFVLAGNSISRASRSAPAPFLPPGALKGWSGEHIFVGCIAVVGLLLFLTWMVSLTRHVSSESPSHDSGMNFDAYYTAEQFVKQTYPGAEKVSAYRDSAVEQDGRTYRVAVVVDGKNSFGGPIRKTVGVEMELVGNTWRLKAIHQR